jgi:hypothetical protein
VQNHFAGPYSETLVSGDPAGIHTIEYTTHGLDRAAAAAETGGSQPGRRLPGLADTFDGDEWLSGELVVNKGPHPDADSDFASSAR